MNLSPLYIFQLLGNFNIINWYCQAWTVSTMWANAMSMLLTNGNVMTYAACVKSIIIYRIDDDSNN